MWQILRSVLPVEAVPRFRLCGVSESNRRFRVPGTRFLSFLLPGWHGALSLSCPAPVILYGGRQGPLA
jgi:hypothetical protein